MQEVQAHGDGISGINLLIVNQLPGSIMIFAAIVGLRPVARQRIALPPAPPQLKRGLEMHL